MRIHNRKQYARIVNKMKRDKNIPLEPCVQIKKFLNNIEKKDFNYMLDDEPYFIRNLFETIIIDIIGDALISYV